MLTREKDLDQVEVQVEVTKEMFSDRVSALEALRQKIGYAIHTTTGINAKVSLVEPHTLQRSEGKAKRVLDKRNVA